jgi:hypothetical protein
MSYDLSFGLAEASSSSAPDKADEIDANIRNFAPVARIMKNALPENAKIAKEAKECMQECVSEFISFITSEGKCFSPTSTLWPQECFKAMKRRRRRGRRRRRKKKKKKKKTKA